MRGNPPDVPGSFNTAKLTKLVISWCTDFGRPVDAYLLMQDTGRGATSPNDMDRLEGGQEEGVVLSFIQASWSFF